MPPPTPKPDILKPWLLPPQTHYIFTHASIVDVVNGTILHNQTVKLSNGLITSISPTTTASPPSLEPEYISIPSPNATTTTTPPPITISLAGKYLCPGLIDAHVHLAAVPGEQNLRDLFALDTTTSLLRQPYLAKQILHRGFTTVRDCGGATLALKDAIADGSIHGPRLFIAGQALSQTGGHGDPRDAHDHRSQCCGSINTMTLARLCDGVPSCIQAARSELRTGANFLKIMAGGGVASPTDALDSVQFTGAEIRAIAEVAHNANTYVTAHAYTPRAIRHAVEHGVAGIEHGNFLDADTARYLAAHDVCLTPTLVTYQELANPDYPSFLPEASRRKNEDVLAAGLRSLSIAREAGVEMLFGTDLLGPMTRAQTQEFALRAQVLSAQEILRSATVAPARRFGVGDVLGQVREGFLADLLVLSEDPLGDVGVLDRSERCLLAVLKEGRVFCSRWRELPQDVVLGEGVIE